jgi:hypothetical protein
MILKQIYLYPDLVEFNLNKNLDTIRYQTRFICNYLEQKLKVLKFETKEFNKICLIGYEKNWQEIYVNPFKSLSAPVKFRMEEYLKISPNDLPSYFINLLREGLIYIEKNHQIPLPEILNWLLEFEKNGCINKWIHKEKKIVQHKLKCELICNLNINNFKLNLVIKNLDGKAIFDKEILKTKPDEIIYEHLFKDIVLIDDKVGVTDKFGKVFFKTAIPADN